MAVPSLLPLAVVAMSLVSTYARAEEPAVAILGDRDRALQCLSSAISYEAGNESVEGQEAVAQVILNRVRHPAYPKSVCGVVFQGSTRKTGCQFTFTCDGSLLRPRSAIALSNAKMVAERVISGFASSSVGGATHYHADYVTPYWASSLIKVKTIGAHLFYRMPGAPDTPAYVVPGAQGVEPLITTLASLPKAPSTKPGGLLQPKASAGAFLPWGLQIPAVSSSR